MSPTIACFWLPIKQILYKFIKYFLVDSTVTETKYKFADSNIIPIHYTSSADGTNVVKVFQEALKAAIEHKQKTWWIIYG